MDIQNIIAENIKKYRRLSGNTQKDIAAKLDVSLSLYQKLEQGNRHFTFEQILSLCRIFHIGITDLILDNSLEPAQLELLSDAEKKSLLGYIMTSFGAGEFNSKDVTALINYHKKFGRSILYVKPAISLNGFRRSTFEEKLEYQERSFQRQVEELLDEYQQMLYKEQDRLQLEIQGKQYSKKERELLALEEKISEKESEIKNLDDTIREKQTLITQIDIQKMKYEQDELAELQRKKNKAKKVARMAETKTQEEQEKYELLVAEQERKLQFYQDEIAKKKSELKNMETPNALVQSVLSDEKYQKLYDEYNRLLEQHKKDKELNTDLFNQKSDLIEKNEDLQYQIEELKKTVPDEITSIDEIPDEIKDQFIQEILFEIKRDYCGETDDIRALLLLLKEYREHYKNPKFIWPLKDTNETAFFRRVERKCEALKSQHKNI